MKLNNSKLSKWAVVIATALLFLSLVADWVAPGVGAYLAHRWLESAASANGAGPFPLWGELVRLTGKSVTALGWLSVGAAVLCVWLVSTIFGLLFGAAVRSAEKRLKDADKKNYAFVESAAVALAGLGFALTPGFLVAATRVSPLMVALVPPLGALMLGVYLLLNRKDAFGTMPRLVRTVVIGSIALLLAGYSGFELLKARREFLSLAFPAFGIWLLVGVLPGLAFAWCIRKRLLLGRRMLIGAFVDWAVAIVLMGCFAFASGRLSVGRTANRLVARIIANAEECGRSVFVSDGALDDLFFFMLPEEKRLITLARERDPEYGRELSDWIRTVSLASTNVENLAFAAELGPRALVDEWAKLDEKGFEAMAASSENFFPTRAKWDEACADLGKLKKDEPLSAYLRHMVAVCGNALGCRLIEAGDKQGAWDVFWKISEEVDAENYVALINLSTLADHGAEALRLAVEIVKRKRTELEQRLKTNVRLLHAVRLGGRLYVDPVDLAKYEKEQREAAEKDGPSTEERKFVETVAAASKDLKSCKAAQDEIRKAIRDGKVRLDRVGAHLITLDMALGEFGEAERDAIDVLKLDRHHPAANAMLGSFAEARGDYKRAERYLRRAISTGQASCGAKNDLAWTLYKLKRYDEAEPFARAAVKDYSEAWTFRETLAAILIASGKIEEGERELRQTEELVAKAGIQKGRIVSLEIDRARLLKAKGDNENLKLLLQSLRGRKDLRADEKAEIESLH